MFRATNEFKYHYNTHDTLCLKKFTMKRKPTNLSSSKTKPKCSEILGLLPSPKSHKQETYTIKIVPP